MRAALNEALKAPASVCPNPKVGAVIVHQSKIVGSGYHRGPGKPHAEIEAIRDAERRGFRAFSKAALFCTLEPCSHLNKRTPPCAPAVAEKKFSRIVISHVDPNPQVRGRGIKLLRAQKLPVQLGCLDTASASINQSFIKNQRYRLPYITMKLAMTFDGRMADDKGRSQWITGERSRKQVHQLRAECDGIVVGAKTIDRDNPQLNIRDGRKSRAQKVFILGKPSLARSKWRCVRANRQENIFSYPKRDDLKGFLKEAFSKHNACHLLVEGGPPLAASMLEQGLVDRLILVYGRGIALGQGQFTLKSSRGALKSLSDCISFKPTKIDPIENDLWVEGLLHVYGPHSK